MTVNYERKGSIAYITLARGEALNAMNRQMYADVNAAFQRLNADSEASVAIFSSNDPDAFCAGVDIKDLHQALANEGELEELAAQFSVFFEEPGQLMKPVVAAINGHCVGEGLVMTLFFDIRIAAEDARFSLPEAKMGVPSINGTIRAVQLAGLAPAMELLLTCEERSAQWAKEAGLVNTVVPRDELMEAAERMASSIAGNGDEAIRIMRRLGEQALEEKFSALAAHGQALRNDMASDDMVTRQAKFVGRKKDSE